MLNLLLLNNVFSNIQTLLSNRKATGCWLTKPRWNRCNLQYRSINEDPVFRHYWVTKGWLSLSNLIENFPTQDPTNWTNKRYFWKVIIYWVSNNFLILKRMNGKFSSKCVMLENKSQYMYFAPQPLQIKWNCGRFPLFYVHA